MSLTTNNDQSQQGGAGDIVGTNGEGAGNQGQPNQITQGTQQDPEGGTPTVGGDGTGTIQPVVAPGTQPPARGQQRSNPIQLILWNGNWPGATGKIATYMADEAGWNSSRTTKHLPTTLQYEYNPKSMVQTMAA